MNSINLIQVPQSIYNIMMNFATENINREVLGVFFGKISNNDHLLIEKAYPLQVGKYDEVELVDDDYEKLLPLIRENAQNGTKWVGWFHSHPFKGGDHLFMSRKDISYHYSAQKQNDIWVAFILNPYQKKDNRTTQGLRAFTLLDATKKVREIQIQIV